MPGRRSRRADLIAMARATRMLDTRGAHLLLQVRTRVLSDQLAGDFYRCYPGFNQAPDPVALAA